MFVCSLGVRYFSKKGFGLILYKICSASSHLLCSWIRNIGYFLDDPTIANAAVPDKIFFTASATSATSATSVAFASLHFDVSPDHKTYFINA
jgi:hypothetical protein